MRLKAAYTSNLRLHTLVVLILAVMPHRPATLHAEYQGYYHVQPYATSVCGLELLVYAALRY